MENKINEMKDNVKELWKNNKEKIKKLNHFEKIVKLILDLQEV